jgi:hypothetical protein
MPDEEIRQYAQEKRFHPSILERWLSWSEADKDALLGLALAIKAGENHVRDLIDWLEEISLRDRVAIREILASQLISAVETDPRLGRADKLKRVKDQIRRLRFPRLSATEDRIRGRIRDLSLKPPINLTVPAGLEGGRLHVEFHVSNRREMELMISQLAKAAENPAMAEIFALLAGEVTPEKETFGADKSNTEADESDAAT